MEHCPETRQIATERVYNRRCLVKRICSLVAECHCFILVCRRLELAAAADESCSWLICAATLFIIC